jgi:peptidoglycan hydrolase CwlO-like protein
LVIRDDKITALPHEYVSNMEDPMSTVYNPEADIIAQIERLELEAKDIHRRLEHATGQEDKRVLNVQLKELQEEIEFLKHRIP